MEEVLAKVFIIYQWLIAIIIFVAILLVAMLFMGWAISAVNDIRRAINSKIVRGLIKEKRRRMKDGKGEDLRI